MVPTGPTTTTCGTSARRSTRATGRASARRGAPPSRRAMPGSTPAPSCNVLVQEVGHNNGWMHSSTLKLRGRALRRRSRDSGCTTNEYGNLYSPMGFRTAVISSPWTSGTAATSAAAIGVKVTSSGTFNLHADRDPVQRHPGNADRDAEDDAHVHGGAGQLADRAQELLPRAAGERDAGRDDADQGAAVFVDRGRQHRLDRAKRARTPSCST